MVVGGGSILIDAEKPFVGASYVVKPSFYQVESKLYIIERLVTISTMVQKAHQLLC